MDVVQNVWRGDAVTPCEEVAVVGDGDRAVGGCGDCGDLFVGQRQSVCGSELAFGVVAPRVERTIFVQCDQVVVASRDGDDFCGQTFDFGRCRIGGADGAAAELAVAVVAPCPDVALRVDGGNEASSCRDGGDNRKSFDFSIFAECLR